MGPHHRAIQEMDLPIYLAQPVALRSEFGQHLLPDPGFAPALEAAVHGGPGTIALRQIPPGSAGAQDPQDPV